VPIVCIGGLFGFIFSTDKFVEYAFYTSTGPKDFINAISRLDFSGAVGFVRDRGRLTWLEMVFQNYELTVIGQGLGTLSVDLEKATGWAGGIHNDFIQYLYEGGYAGFLFYLMF